MNALSQPPPDPAAPSRRVALALTGTMVGAAIVGGLLRPSGERAGTAAPRYVLADIVPTRFADWSELPNPVSQVVNPQTQEQLDRLYSQILTRTYAHADGYRIMLSLAYGNDQRGGLRAHKPEACYPAQGFALHSNEAARIVTPFGDIPARRLVTSLPQRHEPVTYWFTSGDTAIGSRFEQRLLELRLWLSGEIPDGLLFRVSSIDAESSRAFDRQQSFVTDLLNAVPPADRKRLSGLAGPPARPA